MIDLGFMFPLAGAIIIGSALWVMWPRRKSAKLVGHITVTPAEKADLRRIRDCAEVNAGRCPDCGASGSLCEGPSGGMNVNTACDQCLMEFNIASWPGQGAVTVDRTGKLTRSRGRVFGFTEADFAGKDVAP